jgi:UDP-glucose:(heptosyl)LPS alpha-1,3-glucosyltransferase
LAQPVPLRLRSRVLADRRRVAVVARRITGLSGVTILIREHAARAAAAGWETHVFGERVDADAIRSAGATPHPLRPGFFHRRTAQWFASAAADATATGFTLVHGHGDALNQDVLSLHNCIHAVHEAVYGTPLDAAAPPAEAAIMHARQLSERRFRLLVANSNLMRDDVTTRFGVPVESIRVVYPGFDPARYRPRRRTTQSTVIRRRLGVTDDDVLAGLVTSGDWVKRGVADFIVALGIVARGSPLRVHGVVTGKERSMNRYVALAKRHGVADRLHFLPPNDVLEHVYGALDVFVYPARFEEFGMCVQEAMACALPVVCGRRIGATELLDPVASKLLLDTVNPGTVAEMLALFVADEDLRKRVGALNAACVAKNSWDRSAAGVIAAYDELAQS